MSASEKSDAFQAASAAEREQFSLLRSGGLTASQRSALDEQLQADAGLRKRYLEWSILETDLESVWSGEEIVRPLRPEWTRRQTPLVPWVISSALLGAAAAVAVLLVTDLLRTSPWAKEVSSTVNVAALSPDDEILSGNQSTIAFLVEEGDAVLAASRPAPMDGRLTAGRFALASGRAHLLFLNGTHLVAHGPCELILESPRRARLRGGQVAIKTWRQKMPFRLNVPRACLIDDGAEFAVNVDQSGASRVHVQSGELAVSVLNDAGRTHLSSSLSASRALLIAPHAEVPLVELSGSDKPRDLPRVTPLPQESFSVPPAYPELVQASDPLIYWRFENVDANGFAPDHGRLGCRAKLVRAAGSDALKVKQGLLQLRASPTPRRIESEWPLPSINRQDYSLEMWACSSALRFQSLCALILPGGLKTQRSTAHIELAHNSGLSHGPMAYRAVNRTPASNQGGYNAFAENYWFPGRWRHLVLVSTQEQMHLYIDGALAASISAPREEDHFAYSIAIGQLHTQATSRAPHLARQFVGAIDEFAVYDRAISAEEIEAHHQVGRRGVSPAFMSRSE